MFDISTMSFRDRIVFGAPSEGSGGSSSPAPGTIMPDGSVFLGVIELGATEGPGELGDGGDGDIVLTGGHLGGSGGSGNVSITLNSGAYTIDSSEVIDTFSSSGSVTINGPITLETVSDYTTDNSAALEADYAAQDSFVQALGLENSSAAEVRALVSLINQAGNGGPATVWDFAVAEGIELYPGVFEEMYNASQISDAHLRALELVEEGYTVAEAQMIANGHLLDEFVFSDGSGNFAEADVINNNDIQVSSGIDVTDGLVLVDPMQDGLPSFALPGDSGMDGITGDDTFFHDYYVPVSAPSNIIGQQGLDAIEWALQHNPTPGNDAPATINGTRNDVEGLHPLGFDWGDNFVFSYVVDNPNPDQTDIVVNYTIEGEHMLEEGYVMRYGQLNDDDSIDIITYGEGNAWEQGNFVTENYAENEVHEVWAYNAQEIFDTVEDILH